MSSFIVIFGYANALGVGPRALRDTDRSVVEDAGEHVVGIAHVRQLERVLAFGRHESSIDDREVVDLVYHDGIRTVEVDADLVPEVHEQLVAVHDADAFTAVVGGERVPAIRVIRVVDRVATAVDERPVGAVVLEPGGVASDVDLLVLAGGEVQGHRRHDYPSRAQVGSVLPTADVDRDRDVGRDRDFHAGRDDDRAALGGLAGELAVLVLDFPSRAVLELEEHGHERRGVRARVRIGLAGVDVFRVVVVAVVRDALGAPGEAERKERGDHEGRSDAEHGTSTWPSHGKMERFPTHIILKIGEVVNL